MQVQRFKTPFAETISTEYFAGFFDGEGCIYLNPSRVKKVHKGKAYAYPEFQLVIGQSGPEGEALLSIIKEKYGFGKLREVVKKSSFIQVKPAYMIQTSGKNALRILKEIEPFLFVKKEQAVKAIEFMEEYYAD